jgi:hypothetical protein
MLEAYRRDSIYTYTPSIFLQRSRLVPRLSMEQLYVKHSVREVGLLKLDCEGLDVSILQSYLSMLDKYHLPQPCLLSLEVAARGVKFYTSVVELMQGAGYRVISLTHPHEAAPSAGDFYGLHSMCPQHRREELKMFLPDNLWLAEEVCSGHGSSSGSTNSGGREAYCCTTQYGDEEGRGGVDICDRQQPFYVEK